MLFHLSQELSTILKNEQKREITYWKLMEDDDDQIENQENNNEMMNNSKEGKGQGDIYIYDMIRERERDRWRDERVGY